MEEYEEKRSRKNGVSKKDRNAIGYRKKCGLYVSCHFDVEKMK